MIHLFHTKYACHTSKNTECSVSVKNLNNAELINIIVNLKAFICNLITMFIFFFQSGYNLLSSKEIVTVK
jgi:hypothetical protein